jgi:hypothetical protein
MNTNNPNDVDTTNIDELPTVDSQSQGQSMGQQNLNQNINLQVSEMQHQVQHQQAQLPQTQHSQMMYSTSSIQNQPQNIIQQQPPQYSQISQQNTSLQSHSSLSQEDINKIINGIQTASQNNLTTLPSRDIPMNVSSIHQDPSVNPNYIPSSQSQGNMNMGNTNGQYNQHKYIDNIESKQSLDTAYVTMKNKQQQQVKNDELFDEIQTPLLIVLLFFLFQMPLFNKLLHQYIPSLFINDGNLGFSGYMFKALLFGIMYFSIIKTINYLSVV